MKNASAGTPNLKTSAEKECPKKSRMKKSIRTEEIPVMTTRAINAGFLFTMSAHRHIHQCLIDQLVGNLAKGDRPRERRDFFVLQFAVEEVQNAVAGKRGRCVSVFGNARVKQALVIRHGLCHPVLYSREHRRVKIHDAVLNRLERDVYPV